MLRIVSADYLDKFRVRLEFSDGVEGVVDMSGKLEGPVFRPLNDPTIFQQFELTDHTLTWSCGADFAPEYLHDLVVEANAPAESVVRKS